MASTQILSWTFESLVFSNSGLLNLGLCVAVFWQKWRHFSCLSSVDDAEDCRCFSADTVGCLFRVLGIRRIYSSHYTTAKYLGLYSWKSMQELSCSLNCHFIALLMCWVKTPTCMCIWEPRVKCAVCSDTQFLTWIGDMTGVCSAVK